MADLKALVKKEKSDIGIIFDGDADRVMFVDENGRFISPDLIIALLGHYFYEERGLKGDVLIDIRTSKAVPEYLARFGAKVHMKFFGRDGIVFDDLSGTFRAENIASCEVELIGAGIVRHWVANALYRNGFTPSAQHNLPICIEIKSGLPTEFILSKPDSAPVKMMSVESLMRKLRAS